MPSNVYPSQGIETRLVRETAYGATPGSPTYKRLNGFGVTLGATVETDPFAAPGQLVPGLVMVNDDFSTGSVDGRLDFNGLTYVFAGLLGPPTTTTIAAGEYEHVWTWNGRRPNRPVSYTIHNGFAESVAIATGFIFNSMGISGGRGDGFDVSGDGFAKALSIGTLLGGLTNEVQTLTPTTVTAGVWALTFDGETLAAIPYNVTAGALQTLMEGMANIEPGDVTLTGGPMNTTPIVITFGGYYAGQNVSAITVDNTGLTGTIALTTTTPGADAVSDVPAVPAGAVLGDVYLDTTWAGLGGTQLLHAYNMSYNIGERMGRVRPINKSKSSDAVIDTADQDHTVAITFGRNAVADAQLTRLRNATRVFPRMQWTHDQLINATNAYRLQLDTTLTYTEVGEPGDVDNASVLEYTGRMTIDPVSGNVLRVALRNAVATL